MCGRFAYYETDDLDERFGVTVKSAQSWGASYNVAPGQHMPVVLQEEASIHAEAMKWGLIPSWAKDPKMGYKLINARAETIFDKPMWRNAVVHRRCLVPANGFYEWQKTPTGKQPFFIYPKDGTTFAFAGVYETWHTPDGEIVRSFSIVTTQPNSEMTAVHDRMPVILHRQDEASWLDPEMKDREEIAALLDPFEDGGLTMIRVSSDVNSPRINDAHLLARFLKTDIAQ